MRSAYLFEAKAGDAVEVRDGRVELRREGEVAASVPIRAVAWLAVQGRAAVDTATLGKLAEEGVCLHLLSGRNGRWRGAVWGAGPRSATPLVAQVSAYLDPPRRLAMARQVVDAKLAGLVSNLEAWRPLVRTGRSRVAEARGAVEAAKAQCAEADLGSLLGHEGAAAKAYFGVVGLVLPAWTRFTGRNRRPPRDPVNAALSYAYTLATAEATSVALCHGFDPRVGFLHELAPGRHSLACDLVETVRPLIDVWAVELFRGRLLRPADFERDGDACLLANGGRKRFLDAFGDLRERVQPVLTGWATRWRRDLVGEGEPDVGEEGHGG